MLSSGAGWGILWGMNGPPTGKLNLKEAMGQKPADDEAPKPTLRIKRSDLKVLRRHPMPPKKKVAFGIAASAVALALACVLWFTKESWLPFWQDVLPASGSGDAAVSADAGAGGGLDAAEAADAGGGAQSGAPAPAVPDGPLPPPETLTYFSAAGWGDESFRQAVRHFNAGFDAYRAFLADDTSSRPLAMAETEAIAALKLLQEIAADAPEGMRNEVAYDVLQARSLLAEVRRLARDPSASAGAAAKAAAARPSAADAPLADGANGSKIWKNPDYLEAARTFNRAVAKYREFLGDKAGRQALLKEIEDDAFAAAKKFESLKPSAPAGIPLQDHITQCYKLISDCRRQQLESPSRPDPSGNKGHPARRDASR